MNRNASPPLHLTESIFLIGFVLLRVPLLFKNWGYAQDFDAVHYIHLLKRVEWFADLPPVGFSFTSYHPPLSYLLTRLLFPFSAGAVEASQLFSTLCIIGTILLLRSMLKRIGILQSLAGVVFLYVTAGLPLYVFLSYASTIDTLVLFWTVCVLWLSVALFWNHVPSLGERWSWSQRGLLCLLVAALSAGLLTKYTGLLNVSIPFFVVAVRARSRQRIVGVVLIALAALLVVSPFYYLHYYQAEKEWMPISMDWQRSDLAGLLEKRDSNRLGFVLHMMRFPITELIGVTEPVFDSLPHSVWMQTWKRDAVLGRHPSSLPYILGDTYLVLFLFITLLGTGYVGVFYGRIPKEWRDLGLILLGMALVFVLALIVFGYRYPVWEWRIFKAKYIAPALLWVPYCAAVCTHVASTRFRSERLSFVLHVSVLSALFLYLSFNIVLPVY